MAETFTDAIDLSEYLEDKPDGESIRPAAHWREQVVQLVHGGGLSDGAWLPWTKTHDHIRLRSGEVSLWHGENFSGKSTLTSQVAVDLCAQGYRTCVASFEMQPAKTLFKMNRQAMNTNQPSIDEIGRFHNWTDEKLWLFDKRGNLQWERMVAVVKYARDKFDISHFFIDSLMKCVRGEDDFNGQKDFVSALCAVAIEYDMHIHLVHHTRKPGAHDTGKIPSRYDAKGSGSITDQVDNVFGIWRRRDDKADADQPDCFVNCDKQRNGEWDGKIALWFDPRSMQYKGDRMAMLREYVK